MALYVKEYNLSFLRMLVLWFLAVLMIIFFGVICSIYRKDFRLFRYITAVVSVCYILFSFSGADAQISREQLKESRMEESAEDYFRGIMESNKELSVRQWNYSRSLAGKSAEEWLSDRE